MKSIVMIALTENPIRQSEDSQKPMEHTMSVSASGPTFVDAARTALEKLQYEIDALGLGHEALENGR